MKVSRLCFCWQFVSLAYLWCLCYNFITLANLYHCSLLVVIINLIMGKLFYLCTVLSQRRWGDKLCTFVCYVNYPSTFFQWQLDPSNRFSSFFEMSITKCFTSFHWFSLFFWSKNFFSDNCTFIFIKTANVGDDSNY